MAFVLRSVPYLPNHTILSKKTARKFNYVFCSEIELFKRAQKYDFLNIW